MRTARYLLYLLAAPALASAPASAKPEPDPPTLRFIAACIRDLGWTRLYDDPAAARQWLSGDNAEERRRFHLGREQAITARRYLDGLSDRAFRRHLADALYLTTPRHPTRYGVAYAAAMRGYDVEENAARLADAVAWSGTHREAKPWETRLMSRLYSQRLSIDVADVPHYLAQIYRRHPRESILDRIFRMKTDGCLGECRTATVASLAADRTEALLRYAVRRPETFRLFRIYLSGDVGPDDRTKARASLRRIVRSGGTLARPARECLDDMARVDRERARPRQ